MDCQASVAVCAPEEIGNFQCQVVVLGDSTTLGRISSQPASNPDVARADSLAYLLYTSGMLHLRLLRSRLISCILCSGTTGLPKGCLLNHEGLSALVHEAGTFGEELATPDTDKQLGLACEIPHT